MAVLDEPEPDTSDPTDVPTITHGDSDSEDSEESCVEIVDSGSDIEICEETELMKFSRILRDAQEAALAKERAKGIKRKAHQGPSRTTLWRRKGFRNHLAAQGIFPIHEFMKRKKDKKKKEELIFEESEESSDNDIFVVSSSTFDGTEIVSHAPAASEVHCQVAQDPTVGDARRLAARALVEEEEESAGSESESDACEVRGEGRQDVTMENESYCVASNDKSQMGGPIEDLRILRHRAIMEVVPSYNSFAMVLRDRPKLRAACTRLTAEGNNKNLDMITRRRTLGMLGLLNLFLDEGVHLSWKKSSVLVSKAQGHGDTHARRIREWTMTFLQAGNLPHHHLGQARWTVLSDEDIASEIKLQIVEMSKKGYLKAEDLVDLVASPEMQKVFFEKGICKPSISTRTAIRWLQKLDWRYQSVRNGMYIDGHEREDVVAYRRAFLERWKTYDLRFHRWDDDGHELPRPNGFPVPDGPPFRLVLITHDESTFYQNDHRKIAWAQNTSRPAPQPKGEGQSIMISDFLTSEWGRLRDDDEEARIVFKAGKNRDGYFGAEELLAQVDSAIDIFEGLSKGLSKALFLFDNAPSHQKRAPDAISARKMSKGPKQGWTHHAGGPRMRPGQLPNGDPQSFYFPDDHPSMPGWFKGMERIIQERGLWPAEGLIANCPNCRPGCTNCCCRRLLFSQPDFIAQKSQLQELIESRGHLCDFYPKYHCELNFIEQYWGAAKLRFRSMGRAGTIREMEENVIACLDDIPLHQIRRYANRSARFISAYSQGLSGAQAVWANRKYHSHRTLPPELVAEVRQSILE